MKFAEFLAEAPLPDVWDKDKFKGRLDFKGMVEYAMQKSKTLGEGSSRVAFNIEYKGRETALKIAKNPKGIAQNVQEIMYLNNEEIKKLNITIPLIDYDTTNHKARWLHTEKADKIYDSYFEEEIGLPLRDAILYINRDINPPKMTIGSKLQAERGELLKKDSPIVKAIYKLLTDFPEIGYGDLARIQNWGMYKGHPVILDIGYDSTSSVLYKLEK